MPDEQKNNDSAILNVLSIKEHITIMSEKTHLPYIGENGECYVVEAKSEAEGIMQKFPDTYLSESHRMRQLEILSEFWSNGVEQIYVKEKGTGYSTMKLSEVKARGSRNAPYNHETCKVLNLLMETSNSGYLKQMEKLPFFIPVIIDGRMSRQSQSVRYVYVIDRDMKKYYPFFSTLPEFEQCVKEQDGNWLPLQTTFRDFAAIRNQDNIVIDPVSKKLILQNYVLKKYLN